MPFWIFITVAFAIGSWIDRHVPFAALLAMGALVMVMGFALAAMDDAKRK